MDIWSFGTWDIAAIGSWIGVIAGLYLMVRALMTLHRGNVSGVFKTGGLGFISLGLVSVIVFESDWADYGINGRHNAAFGVASPQLGPWAQLPTVIVLALAFIGAALLIIGWLITLGEFLRELHATGMNRIADNSEKTVSPQPVNPEWRSRRFDVADTLSDQPGR